MVAGHFGLAAAVKSRVPTAPLWALMVATQWLDIIFVPLFLLGIETIDPTDTANPNAYGGGVIHAVYTHSLVGALALSALLGGLAWLRWGRRVGVTIGLVAFSHWILDLLVHRPDLPILPGARRRRIGRARAGGGRRGVVLPRGHVAAGGGGSRKRHSAVAQTRRLGGGVGSVGAVVPDHDPRSPLTGGAISRHGHRRERLSWSWPADCRRRRNPRCEGGRAPGGSRRSGR
jgi:membrane-bound metal-dependent hydrolase YbcI (DUF457 family)